MSRKGENIYKRKDGRWEGRYIKAYKPNGKPWYGYCYGRTYREVKEAVTIKKASVPASNSSMYVSKNKDFGGWSDEWLVLKRNSVKESTYVKYSGIIEKHIKPRLGTMSLAKLSTVAIECFANELLQEEFLSAKTVKDILTLVHSVLDFARKCGNCLAVSDIVYPKLSRNEMRVLSPDEQQSFMLYLLEPMDRCKFSVLLALATGMRIGEICALRWKNISIEERTVSVNSTMQRLRDLSENKGQKTKIVIGEPKSASGARIIPLTEHMVQLCASYRCDDPDAFVLTGVADRYFEPRALQYRFSKYTAACNLKGVHFHSLRHTFATRCVELDFELKSLSEILGHASPRITLDRYVHSSLALKRENMNKLTAIGL